MIINTWKFPLDRSKVDTPGPEPLWGRVAWTRKTCHVPEGARFKGLFALDREGLVETRSK